LKSWRIEVKPSAEKQYLSLDRKTRHRIKANLQDLAGYEIPFFHPHVKPLTGKLKGDYRLRVGNWRVLFTPEKEKKILYVYAILPRGDAY
jgi:mRNA interferase RelE/StbE